MTASAALKSRPPVSAEQAERLLGALDGLDADGLWWTSGFVAGLALAARREVAPPMPAVEASPSARLTVIYGSQTGNARRLAESLVARAESEGLAVRLFRADAYPLRELKDERLLYLVISTQGDGDPPEDAVGLVEHLGGRRAPKLPQLAYAVLGLGDSSYPRFCEVGRALDARLAELGGKRLFERGDADLDINTIANPWLDRALAEAARQLQRDTPAATVTPLRRGPTVAPVGHDRDRPFSAELLVNQRIVGRGSDQDVRHIELSLDGSGLSYAPGDALGVWPENDPILVAATLERLGLSAEATVEHGGERRELATWLGERRELTRLSRAFMLAHAARAGEAELNALLADAEAARVWLTGHQVIDLLERWPATWSPEELVAALPVLSPRLYSISSSPAEVGAEAHLTVALARSGAPGRERFGAASRHLAEAAEGARVRVFVEANERFRLPADGERDIIMIGPGTGVAPFRAFVQQRAAEGAGGRNWLFFGARRFREDFLYQLEWQRALKQGRLSRLDLAFSRDGGERVHVQQRLSEQGRAVFDWLEGGAQLYVCGAVAMGKDVHRSLVDLVARHGGRSPEDAEEYLRTLQQQGRYARDVY